MKTAIFGDIHGNLPALETFVAATRGTVDRYVCLGDIVNYGPWGDECVDVVTSLPNVVVLEGNHERLFLGIEPVESELELVRSFFRVARPRFTRVASIQGLPVRYRLGNFMCVHTIGDGQRVYPDSQVSLDDNYVIGHTHHQFRIVSSGYELVNTGSIGQNRARIDEIQYVVHDSNSGGIELFTQAYPVEVLLCEMKALGYPAECIEYYCNKPGGGKDPAPTTGTVPGQSRIE